MFHTPVLRLSLLVLFWLSAIADVQGGSSAATPEDTVNQLNAINKVLSNGGTNQGCVVDPGVAGSPFDAPPHNVCPRYLVEKAYSDRNGSFIQTKKIGTEAPSSACTTSLRNFKSLDEVKSFFAGNLKTGEVFSNSIPLTGDCISGVWYPPDDGSGMSEPVHWQLNDAERLNVLAEYAHSKERLFNDRMGTFESIASIDAIMGDPILNGVSCKEIGIESSGVSQCNKLKGCASLPKRGATPRTKSFVSIFGQTNDAVKAIALAKNALSKQRQELQSMVYPNEFGPPTYASGYEKKAKDVAEFSKIVQIQENILTSTYPWLNGKYIKKFLNSRVKDGVVDYKLTDLDEALAKQFTETRSKLKNRMQDLSNATRCLDTNDRKQCKNFDKTLASTALPPDLSTQGPKHDPKAIRSLETNALFSQVECLQAHRDVKQMTNQWAQDTAIGAGLAIATMGLGTYVAAGRAANATIQLGRGTAALEKAREAGVIAQRMIWAMDGMWAAEGAVQAAKECKDLMGDLVPSNAPIPQIAGCPSGEEYSGANLTANLSGCLLSAALHVGLNALPYTPEIVRKYRVNLKVDEAEKALRRVFIKDKVADNLDQKIAGFFTEAKPSEGFIAKLKPSVLLQKPVQVVTESNWGKPYNFTPSKAVVEALERKLLPEGKAFTIPVKLAGGIAVGTALYPVWQKAYDLIYKKAEAIGEKRTQIAFDNAIQNDFRFSEVRKELKAGKITPQQARDQAQAIVAAYNTYYEFSHNLAMNNQSLGSDEINQIFLKDPRMAPLFGHIDAYRDPSFWESDAYQFDPAKKKEMGPGELQQIMNINHIRLYQYAKIEEWFPMAGTPDEMKMSDTDRTLYKQMQEEPFIKKAETLRNQINPSEYHSSLMRYLYLESRMKELSILGATPIDRGPDGKPIPITLDDVSRDLLSQLKK